ncbi:MAG: hypothetical protein A2Y33_06030 [Spirochaetes bacterium GWF1_51_8]|nr:MAG: hypothetical protein A2Y33_06030 [Spirochaetes bacterium GWF1_51_8]
MLRITSYVLLLLFSTTTMLTSSKNQLDSKGSYFSLKDVNLKNPQNVLDYFLLLPNDFFSEFNQKGYNIMSNFIHGKSSLEWAKIDDVVIDKKNAFIHISVNINESVYYVDFTYFLDSKQEKVFGFTTRIFRQQLTNSFSAIFLEYKDKKYYKINGKVLPNINFQTFWDESLKLPEKKYQIYQLEYILPQHGTTVSVYFHEIYFLIDPFDNSHDKYGIDQNDYYSKVITKYKYGKIDLSWNKEKGIFSFKKKYTISEVEEDYDCECK